MALESSFGCVRATCSYPWTTEPQNVQSTSSSSGVSVIVSGVSIAGASSGLILVSVRLLSRSRLISMAALSISLLTFSKPSRPFSNMDRSLLSRLSLVGTESTLWRRRAVECAGERVD